MEGFKILVKNKIMHRDFKIENLFLKNDKILIGDFGISCKGIEKSNEVVGSYLTMAPEVLNLKPGEYYNNKIDLWSIGFVYY